MECVRDIYICLRVYYWIDLSMCKGFELLFLIYDDWGVVIDIESGWKDLLFWGGKISFCGVFMLMLFFFEDSLV